MPGAITSLSLDAALTSGGPSATSFARLWRSLWDQPYLPNALLELCRLTFARLHADSIEMEADNALAPGPTPDQRQAVLADRALDDPAIPEDWKSALLFAEYYWVDTQSIPDIVADTVKAHHGEAGLVFLIEALGCLDGRIRTARCLRDLATGGRP